MLPYRVAADSHVAPAEPDRLPRPLKSSAEAVRQLLQAAAGADPRATILSVDAVGALDHVSRPAMLGALAANPALQHLLPYARQFHPEPSSYTLV